MAGAVLAGLICLGCGMYADWTLAVVVGLAFLLAAAVLYWRGYR